MLGFIKLTWSNDGFVQRYRIIILISNWLIKLHKNKIYQIMIVFFIWKHFESDEKIVIIWSEYVLELIELDKWYPEVIYQLCVVIDNCVR